MKESTPYSTEALQEHISYCDNLEDFSNEILYLSQGQRNLWKEKIASIMQESGYTLAALAKLCGVSHVAVRKCISELYLCRGSGRNLLPVGRIASLA